MSDFWSERRVFLSGHTGFKGGWLALWLHELGAAVTGFADVPPTDPALFELARISELVDDVRGDVRERTAVQSAVARAQPEVVFHLAAQPVVRRAWREPADAYAINTLGTVHVLEAVRRHAPEATVVVITTDKVYADPDSGRRFGEDDPLGGKDPYSASKAAAELAAASYRDSYGLRIATARAGNVIGGGDWAEARILPDAVRAARAGIPLVVRDPAAIRPWQHVLNPLSGYVTLAQHLAGSEEYARAWNFAPPLEREQRPVSWLVERFAAELGGDLELAGSDLRDGPVEAARVGLDPTLAGERLGWNERWPLERGLDETAAWYRRVVFEGADAREMTLAQIEAFGEPGERQPRLGGEGEQYARAVGRAATRRAPPAARG
jgi:CDP-glucose 4,6-dehydratase